MVVFWHVQVKNNITNKAFNELLYHDAKRHNKPAPDNYLPRSQDLLEKLLDVMPAAATEVHMCPKCFRRFPQLDPTEWVEHADATCRASGCGERRFKLRREASGRAYPQLRPALRWF